MKNMIAIAALLSSASALTVTQEVESQMAEGEKEVDSLLAQTKNEAMEGECAENQAECTEQGCGGCWRRWPAA